MQIRLALEGNLKGYWQAEKRLGAQAVTTAIRRATSLLKNDVQRQVKSAGLDRNTKPGKSASKTWRSEVYPQRGYSMGAAGRVWTKWPKAMEAFEKGAAISAGGGNWLAVQADKDAGLHQSTQKVARVISGRRDLQFIKTRNANVAALIDKRTGQVVFWLYRQVRITKRINFFDAAEKWNNKVPEYIVNEWNKLATKRGLQGLK